MAHACLRFSVSGVQEVVFKDAYAGSVRTGRHQLSVLWQRRCGAGALGCLSGTAFEKECLKLFELPSEAADDEARGQVADGRARTEMSWIHLTPEQWMRIGFIALVLVGVICTLLIVVARLN